MFVYPSTERAGLPKDSLASEAKLTAERENEEAAENLTQSQSSQLPSGGYGLTFEAKSETIVCIELVPILLADLILFLPSCAFIILDSELPTAAFGTQGGGQS